MSPIVVAFLVFASSFGAALIGMILHVRLPERHLNSDSREVVKLVMGLIATIAALVLGLLIASAHAGYEQQQTQLQQLSANLILLDQTLETYGPDANAARAALRRAAEETHDSVWGANVVQPKNLSSAEVGRLARDNIDRVQKLRPNTDEQRALQSRAGDLQKEIVFTRLLMVEELQSSIPLPLVAVLVFWICALFLGFGLFADFNATVVVALVAGALSVAGAIFLILEFTAPYTGIMRVSDAPLLNAIRQIDAGPSSAVRQ
jgi:hypothetical protein